MSTYTAILVLFSAYSISLYYMKLLLASHMWPTAFFFVSKVLWKHSTPSCFCVVNTPIMTEQNSFNRDLLVLKA